MKNQAPLGNFKYLTVWNSNTEMEKTPNKVVVTAFLQNGDKFLVLQRARKDEQYQLWGIPGGKLDQNELPIEGLLREINEETGLKLDRNSFCLLGTAISCTPTDGQYGLYLYHSFLKDDVKVQIDGSEHSAYNWVTLSEFESLNLLTAQREAYHLVEEKLKKLT